MTTVTFQKSGLFVHKNEKVDGEWVEEMLPPDDPITLLRCECTIEEGVNLGDIFAAVDAIPELKEFMSKYSWCSHISEFHEDAKKPIPSEPDGKEMPLTHLVIKWFCHNWRYKGGCEFEIYTDFHGVGENEDVKISVSYSPMWELSHLPVRLDNNVTLYKPPGKGTGIIYQGTRGFSLLDVLDSIYDDISFMGGPEDNAAFMEDMKETIEGINSGEIETFPMDLPKLDDDEYHDPQNN